MNGRPFLQALSYVIGAGLILLGLADVYMTVLYARAGTGPLSHRLATAGWSIVRRLSRLVPRRKSVILAAFGPTYLVLLLAIWVGLLVIGFTLLAWPGLGDGIQSQGGATPRDFMSAFYYAGGSLTTVGSGDLRPVSPLYKCLTVVDSVIGISVLTMALTYFIQIYTSLQARNSYVLALHHASGGTGDAAALLKGLGPGDDFSRGQSTLAGFASSVTSIYESHHFYSVLIYFRFSEPHYAMSRATLIAMEMLALIDTALDERRHGWLKDSASVTQLREAGMHALTEFSDVYLPGGPPEVAQEDGDIAAKWKRRYRAAVEHLRRAGISVTQDESAGADRYVALRRQWDSFIVSFATYMEHDMREIDPAGVDPSETGRHREMPVPPVRDAATEDQIKRGENAPA